MNEFNEIATREEMIKEATKRLKMLSLDKKVLKSFKKDQTLFYSADQKFQVDKRYADDMFMHIGALWHVRNNKEFVDTIKNFEKKSGGLVYHATYSKETIYENENPQRWLNLFYITPYKEEWWYNREELNDKCAFVYRANLDHNLSSSFRIVHFKTCGGGLIAKEIYRMPYFDYEIEKF